MTTRFATCLAIVLLAGGLSAQHTDKKPDAPNLTGTWNMGLQGDHVIPTALTLKQNGKTLTGTIALPTQRVGERREVALEGEFADAAFTISGPIDGAAEPTTIEIAGKLNDDGSMEGTMKSPHGTMTWTAERLKERK